MKPLTTAPNGTPTKHLAGPGSCCEVGYECDDQGRCVAAVTKTSILPSSGNITVTSIITVSGMPLSPGGQGGREALTAAQRGGIVGGVVGFAVVLGIVVWLIMRRLNQLMKLIRTRPDPEEANGGGANTLNEQRVGIPNQYSALEPPIEVWDPHSQGIYPNSVSSELAGSYEAHGVSEMGEREPTEKK
ncbi:hypothetical protein O1611_g3692 [Lasiodiplodia mahajangana]|uniref:Uncharacterized protein n=1 Tax=Lasiodiplodia mahajangana TaxID=1108764 RepID=A0ACC2JR02_9PEZI|nr:hypothetical protein O1611_g3692 [Lasiodiplodia mahajangana]